MSDLIERLRGLLRCRCEPDAACCEACSAVDAVDDEIERLRTEVACLKDERHDLVREWREALVHQRDKTELMRRELVDEKGAADAYAMRVTELERELAEARGLLREMRTCISLSQYDELWRRIDAFLTAADQPSEGEK